jgi:hypothetical protein
MDCHQPDTELYSCDGIHATLLMSLHNCQWNMTMQVYAFFGDSDDNYMFILDGKYGDKEPFTFEDIFNATFQPKSYDVKWIVGTG